MKRLNRTNFYFLNQIEFSNVANEQYRKNAKFTPSFAKIMPARPKKTQGHGL